MKVNIFLIFLIFYSFPSLSKNICSIFDDNGELYLLVSEGVEVGLNDRSYRVSRLEIKNYCMLYKNKNDKSEVFGLFYNKKTGESYGFDNFYAAYDSPNGRFTAVLSGDTPGLVTKISILDENGLRSYQQSFSQAYDVNLLNIVFSADSGRLNFYAIEEYSISYNSLDLESGELYMDVASGDGYLTALKSDINTTDATFAFFVPVSEHEFAAITSNNYLGYYKGGIALWTKEIAGQQGLSRLLGVGNIYVVVLNEKSGIDLYRKRDGVKYSVLLDISDEFTTSNINIVNSRFVGINQLILSYESGNKTGTLLIDLNTHKVNEIK